MGGPLKPSTETDAARAVISGGRCSIDDASLDHLRTKASKLIGQGAKKGFGDFPIDRGAFRQETLDHFLTKKRICTTLTADSGATVSNHNRIRDEYKAQRMTPAEAIAKGVVAKQIPVKEDCPTDYSWCDSMAYNDVDNCEEVTEEIDGYGMPTVMYAIEGAPAGAQAYIDRLKTSTLYTKYTNGGPRACSAGRDEKGRRFADSYHSLAVLFTSVQFVMRTFAGRGWTAWTMRRSCKTPEGKTLEADDLMFNFGMRIFLPLKAAKDGKAKDRTVVMTFSAAASNSFLSEFVTDSYLQKVGWERFIGAEYAKKVLLDARGKGWEIRR